MGSSLSIRELWPDKESYRVTTSQLRVSNPVSSFEHLRPRIVVDTENTEKLNGRRKHNVERNENRPQRTRNRDHHSKSEFDKCELGLIKSAALRRALILFSCCVHP